MTFTINVLDIYQLPLACKQHPDLLPVFTYIKISHFLVGKIEQAAPGDVKPVVKASQQLILSNLKNLQIAILLVRVTPANNILKFLEQHFFKTHISSYFGNAFR